jgi:hypothetical protein
MEEREVEAVSQRADEQKSSERKTKDAALHASRAEIAQLIADQLGESEEEPKRHIYKIVKRLGADQALAYARRVQEIEAAGGVMLPDGSRRRTPGGVFFWLVKSEQPPGVVRSIFFRPRPKQESAKTNNGTSASVQPAPLPPPFSWEDRLAVLKEVSEEKGSTNVKITLIGRPGKVVERGQCVIMSMQATKIPALPKGLPVPPEANTTYTVYIAAKQWRKVAEAIQDAEDILILEGWPHLDLNNQAKSIAVFVTNATTKKLQAAQRQRQPSSQQETP